jgi:hypothetical protein
MYTNIVKNNNSRKQAGVMYPALFLCAGLAVLSLFSCASQINGSVFRDSSAVFMTDMALQPRMTAMIRALSAASGRTDGTIVNGAAISLSMSESPGIESVALVNTSPSSVKGAIGFSNINDFLVSVDGRKFIDFDQAAKRCQINMNFENGPEILTLFSPDVIEYLNALMAPVVTGEKMSKLEYLNLITMFYSRAIRDEIEGSSIRAVVDFPGDITEVKGGTFSGRSASFNIPLVDLLVLDTPISYEVKWN